MSEDELKDVWGVVEDENFVRKLKAAKKSVQWLLDNTQRLETAYNHLNKKREREPEEVVKKPETDDNFVCPGQIWTDPNEPCVDKKNKNVPVGIKWNNKNWTVCKDCRNAKSRYMKKHKKEGEDE